MFHQERNFMGSNFKHGAGSLDVARTVSKSGIEEPGVVNAKLTVGRIKRNHFRREVRGNAHSLPRRKNVEVPRLENKILSGILMTNFPELFRWIKINAVELDGRGIPLRLV